MSSYFTVESASICTIEEQCKFSYKIEGKQIQALNILLFLEKGGIRWELEAVILKWSKMDHCFREPLERAAIGLGNLGALRVESPLKRQGRFQGALSAFGAALTSGRVPDTHVWMGIW